MDQPRLCPKRVDLLLIGLQLRSVTQQLGDTSLVRAIGYGLIISFVLIASRLLCTLGASVFSTFMSHFITVADPHPVEKSTDSRLGRNAWGGIPGRCTFNTFGYQRGATLSLSQPDSLYYFHSYSGYHVFLNPAGMSLAILVTVLWFIVFYGHRQYFSGIFVQRTPANQSSV